MLSKGRAEGGSALGVNFLRSTNTMVEPVPGALMIGRNPCS